MDESSVHLGFVVWSSLLSVLGVLIMWNWTRMAKQVDDKADKSEVAQLRSDLAARWLQQDKMHAANTRRLDMIILRLGGIRPDEN